MENSRNGAVGGGNANGGSDSPSVESWGWEPGDVSSSIHRRPSEESMTSLLQRHSTDVSIGLPAQLQRASTDSLQSRSNIPSLGAPGSSNRHSNGATNSIGLPLPVGGESFLRISSRNSFGSVSDKRGSSKSLGSIEDSLSNDPDFVNWIDSWGHSTDDLDQSSAGDDNDHVAAAAAGALSAIAPSGAPPARGGGRHSLSPDDQSVHPAKSLLKQASILSSGGILSTEAKAMVKNCILRGDPEITAAVRNSEVDGGSALVAILQSLSFNDPAESAESSGHAPPSSRSSASTRIAGPAVQYFGGRGAPPPPPSRAPSQNSSQQVSSSVGTGIRGGVSLTQQQQQQQQQHFNGQQYHGPYQPHLQQAGPPMRGASFDAALMRNSHVEVNGGPGMFDPVSGIFSAQPPPPRRPPPSSIGTGSSSAAIPVPPSASIAARFLSPRHAAAAVSLAFAPPPPPPTDRRHHHHHQQQQQQQRRAPMPHQGFQNHAHDAETTRGDLVRQMKRERPRSLDELTPFAIHKAGKASPSAARRGAASRAAGASAARARRRKGEHATSTGAGGSDATSSTNGGSTAVAAAAAAGSRAKPPASSASRRKEGQTAAQKRERRAKPRHWTKEEDEQLKLAVTKYGEMSWKLIAAQVPSRSHVQCLQRWKKALDPRLVKGPWSEEEDQLLAKLVQEHGLLAWKTIAKEITGRNTKQCRERWCNYLDPNLKRGKWTAEEDATILAMQKKVGNKWAAITKELPGRTDNQVKIRFNSLHRKETAKRSAEAYLSELEMNRNNNSNKEKQ